MNICAAVIFLSVHAHSCSIIYLQCNLNYFCIKIKFQFSTQWNICQMIYTCCSFRRIHISNHLWKYFQTIDHFFSAIQCHSFFYHKRDENVKKRNYLCICVIEWKEKKNNSFFFLQNRSNGNRNMCKKMGQKQWDEK